MNFLKRIFCLILVLCLIGLGFRYVVKEKFFPYKYASYVDEYSKEYELDPLFVLAVMKTESKFNEDAHSNKNAVGLMQITVETAEWAAKKMGYTSFTKENLYDQGYNIRMGCWYLRYLSDMFNGNIDLIIAAYNGGPSNVKSWLENREYSSDGKVLNYIPFGETKKYVDKVNAYYSIYQYFYDENQDAFDKEKITEILKSIWNVHFLSRL